MSAGVFIEMFSHRLKPRQCAGSDSLSSRGAG
nr:MAG TPA: hypothetical protein [Caudoviricetes sp.]